MGELAAIQKKVCMLGAYGVGKTSLVRQFVEGQFDERYQTTVGVKISKKVVVTEGCQLTMILWDFAGQDELEAIRPAYLRGAAGCILVGDGTRALTLNVAAEVRRLVRDTLGAVPCVAALNKTDLQRQWEVTPPSVEQFASGDPLYRTSAKTGAGVDELFSGLARQMLQKRS